MANDYSRISVVTGSTSGIGEATARKFITAGFAVIGNGRDLAKLKELESELGPAFIGIPGDVLEEGTVNNLFSAAEERFGNFPNLVVVNAGFGLGGSIKNVKISEFEKMLQTNVTGSVRLLKKAANTFETMMADKFPKYTADIVIIGSVSGRNVSPFSYVYGSSKFALHSLAEGLRRELSPMGIRVSLVEPGLVITGFQEKAGYGKDLIESFDERYGPLLNPAHIADTIYFIVSQEPHVHISDIIVRPTRQDYP